jgi:hypothetical protein
MSRLNRFKAKVWPVIQDLPLFLTAPVYRRWHLTWGATDDEAAASMPGDDMYPTPSTRQRGPSPSMNRRGLCGYGWSRWVAGGPVFTATTCWITSDAPVRHR